MPEATLIIMQRANPFKFKHVKQLARPRELEGAGACVVMATPSMLQSGLSRELFEAWCSDARNAVIIADFAVQGTLAREILSAPETIMTRGGARVRPRMTHHHTTNSNACIADQASLVSSDSLHAAVLKATALLDCTHVMSIRISRYTAAHCKATARSQDKSEADPTDAHLFQQKPQCRCR